MVSTSLEAERAQLAAILASSPDRKAIDLILEIVDFANTIGIEAAEHVLAMYPELTEVRPSLSRDFHAYVADLEIAEARDQLKREISAPVSYRSVASPASKAMFDRLHGLAAQVVQRNMRRVVMVGCGWRPVTMFHLHECTDAREIIGLDILPDAVETAAALARKFGYDRIRTELCDGASFDYRDTDLVYVASMVSPKTRVIERILETGPADIRLVLWEPVSIGCLWVESGHPDRNQDLEIYGRSEVRRLSQDVFARRRRTTSPES